MLLEGEENKVKEIVEWLNQGSYLAEIEGINITQEEYKGEFFGFEVRYE